MTRRRHIIEWRVHTMNWAMTNSHKITFCRRSTLHRISGRTLRCTVRAGARRRRSARGRIREAGRRSGWLGCRGTADTALDPVRITSARPDIVRAPTSTARVRARATVGWVLSDTAAPPGHEDCRDHPDMVERGPPGRGLRAAARRAPFGTRDAGAIRPEQVLTCCSVSEPILP